MEWFTWIMWLGIAIVFGLIEVITVNFYTIWFAISAIITAIIAVFISDPIIQIVCFALISLVLVILSEKLLRKLIFGNKDHIAMNVEAMSGKTGIVVSQIRNDRGEGVVKVDGVSWSARSVNGDRIAQNQRVKIHRIEGVKLIVSPESRDSVVKTALTNMSRNISNTKIVESQSYKKVFDKEIQGLKIDLDDDKIDRTDIEIFESDEVTCEYDIGLKDKSQDREFEICSEINGGEFIIKSVNNSIAGDTHYSIALRLGIPSKTRLKINAVLGRVIVKSKWNADITINDLGDLDIETMDVSGDLSIRSTSGDVSVGKINNIELKSAAGDTSIKSCESARIKTSSGDVSIGSVEEGTIQVTSGDLSIDSLDGNLTVFSSSGDILIKECRCRNSISITVKSGDLQIGKYFSKSCQNTIHTTSGDISIGIDKNSSLIGKCENVSGDISIIGAQNEKSITEHKKEFTIGSGEGTLTISSISGDMVVKTN